MALLERERFKGLGSMSYKWQIEESSEIWSELSFKSCFEFVMAIYDVCCGFYLLFIAVELSFKYVQFNL